MTSVLSDECVGFSSSRSPSQLVSEHLQPAFGRPATSLLAEPQADERNGRARSVVGRLHQFERLLRLAAAVGSRLAAEIAEESEAAGLSATVGHQMMVSFGTANMHVATALSHSATGHRQLERLGKALGYDTLCYGDGQKDPTVFGGA